MSQETEKYEESVIEKGGYSAGKLTVSELAPPPPSVSVHVTDVDRATGVEHATVTQQAEKRPPSES